MPQISLQSQNFGISSYQEILAKEWDTEDTLIYDLWEDRSWFSSTIEEPQCKETLQECATLAELLTAPQDLQEVQIRDLETQCGLSYKSLYRLGHSILKTLWEHALDDLHLEYTFDYLYNPENNNYTLDIFVSSDAENDHLGFAWYLLRSS
jgi:hypothetical protein